MQSLSTDRRVFQLSDFQHDGCLHFGVQDFSNDWSMLVISGFPKARDTEEVLLLYGEFHDELLEVREI